MEPGDFVYLATALCALAGLIILFRIFRGDRSDNKGGMVLALVVLGGLVYFMRTTYGMDMINHLFDVMR
jgi:hypothetical protein